MTARAERPTPEPYVRGVYGPLLARLGTVAGIRRIYVDRWSKDDSEGLDAQVARHMDMYPHDPDVQVYLEAIAAGGFADEASLVEGVGFISPADVHHLAGGAKKSVAFFKSGESLFLRVNLSAVTRAIVREDSSSENVYTWLLLSLLNACPDLEEVFWAADVTRAARDDVNWTTLVRRHGELNVRMSFAGVSHDPTTPSGRVQLKILGAVGSEDDPNRRTKLVESLVKRYQRGEFCLGIEMLPYGFNLATNEFGRVAKGTLPVADPTAGPFLNLVYSEFADGRTYEEILRSVAELEAAGGVERRSGNKKKLTFADAVASDDSTVMIPVVQRFIRPLLHKMVTPPTVPADANIDAYLEGADPAEVFDLPQRLVIARVETLRTGVWLRILRNDIRRRGLVVAGVPITRFKEDDEHGFFIIEAPWPWPKDEKTGQVIERFGIPDQVLRRAAVRILRSLAPHNAGPRGGRAHERAERRAVMDFGSWDSDGWSYTAYAAQGAREELVNTILLRRPATETGSWGPQKSHQSESAVATFRQKALAGSLADQIQEAVAELVESEIAPVRSLELRDQGHADPDMDAKRWTAEATRLDSEAAMLTTKAAGARSLASLSMGEGDKESAAAYRDDAAKYASEAKTLRAKADALRERCRTSPTEPTQHAATADLSVIAFLVAGLLRGAEHGRVTTAVGTVADRLLSNWSVVPDPADIKWIDYEVDLTIPLTDGSEGTTRLRGRIPNVRSQRRTPTPGPRRPPAHGISKPEVRIDQAGTLFFVDGYDLHYVSTMTSTAPHTLFQGELPRWAASHGLSNRTLVTALMDHPVVDVRRIVASDRIGVKLTDMDSYSAAWRAHIVETYTDTKRKWGYAACPDDLTSVHSLMAVLADGSSVSRSDVAATLDLNIWALRNLSTPRKTQASGFARPVYVRYGDRSKTTFAAIRCPHEGCDGVAAHAVLVPETASSGFGVICTTCRRMPNRVDRKWAKIVFPPRYVEEAWTAVKPVPAVEKTQPVAAISPLAIPRTK